MFKAERLQKIKELLFDRKQINVSTLSSLLDVSEVTIRSDLEQLESEGFLTKQHGGAVLNESDTSQQEINDMLAGSRIEYNKDKEDIAKIASSMVRDGEHIFLGAGTTTYFIAKELLERRNLTVLTNNLYVGNILALNPYINCILTGGNILAGQYCLVGDMIDRCVENLFLSKAFFAVGGVDLEAGYTLPDTEEAEVYHAVSKRAREVILAIDKTKYDIKSFVKLGDLDMAPTVITNASIDDKYKDHFYNRKIKLLTAYSLNNSHF